MRARSPVTDALAALHDRFALTGTTLQTDYDPEWTSPCERGQPQSRDDGATLIHWQPVPRFDSQGIAPEDFAGLENALEVGIHPDFKAYFSSFWSGGLETTASEGHVSLLQVWNPQDVDRLIENMIGHVLGQRRVRAPLAFFFACTEPDSDLILSIDNASGAVLLEQPGRKPLRTVADSLATFINTLQPAAPADA